ncbi:hypothetical protein LTR70_003171 [Exophiala xenobiotica]|uniref:Uncharacterized protein n=1 Tax=Lithohypha guttulata TaxID=1690604 RepID=A0ABR0KGH1_9EURO|nr:hypothetical protein LTR24_002816 [Lithohypha guttulata]KAK5323683.1 hypothetical protein LTR70_003171 [Exophiala xenobiotica]
MQKPCGNGGCQVFLDLRHPPTGPKANDKGGVLLRLTLLQQMEGFGVLPLSDVPTSLNQRKVNNAATFSDHNPGTSATLMVYLGHIVVTDLLYAWKPDFDLRHEYVGRKAYGRSCILYTWILD